MLIHKRNPFGCFLLPEGCADVQMISILASGSLYKHLFGIGFKTFRSTKSEEGSKWVTKQLTIVPRLNETGSFIRKYMNEKNAFPFTTALRVTPHRPTQGSSRSCCVASRCPQDHRLRVPPLAECSAGSRERRPVLSQRYSLGLGFV